MKKTLDQEFPQGNPSSLTCRHCERSKRNQRGALLCPNCDSRDGEPITHSLLG